MSKKTKTILRSQELTNRRDAALAEAEAIVAGAQAGDEPRELTSYEQGRVDALTSEARSLADEINIARVDERVAEQRAADDAKADKAAKRERKEAKVAQRAEVDANAYVAREADDSKRAKKAAEARNALGLGNIKVTTAERTYKSGGEFSYMRDLVTNACSWLPGWSAAHDRLMRHAKEITVDGAEAERRLKAGSTSWRDVYFTGQIRTGMSAQFAADGMDEAQVRYNAQFRDLSTAAGAGGEWVPPLFLTELWVPFSRPGRPFADSMTRKPLPPGTMSINIPVVTGGTTVASQGSQNTNVSDTDLTTEYDTFPVVTIAGAQILSLQLIERSPIAVDDAVFGDLHLAANQELDRQCINGGLNVGEITGLLNTTGVNSVAWNTGSALTIMEQLYGAIANAKAQIANKRYLPATHAFITPGRWEWLEQQFDGNGRPLIVPEQNGAFILAQLAPDEPVNQGVTGGRLLSLSTLQDFMIPNNLGTGADQDALVVSRMAENWLYETPMIARALPQTYGQQLSVLVQCYFYAAATFARYPFANAYVTGSELSNPISYNQ